MAKHSDLDHTGVTGVPAAESFDESVHDAHDHTGVPGVGAGGALQADKVSRTSGDLSTTSTSFVDATGMSITMTTGARRVLVGVIAKGYVGTNGEYIELDIDIDGAGQGGTRGLAGARIATASSNQVNLSFTYLSDVLTAASHTIKLRWKGVNGNTANLVAQSASSPLVMWVQEQP